MRNFQVTMMREQSDGPSLQTAEVRYGHKIVVGDRVSVDRENFRDKVGVYVGRNYKRRMLKVHFTEFGGCDLLCYAQELRRISVVGKAENITAEDVE